MLPETRLQGKIVQFHLLHLNGYIARTDGLLLTHRTKLTLDHSQSITKARLKSIPSVMCCVVKNVTEAQCRCALVSFVQYVLLIVGHTPIPEA